MNLIRCFHETGSVAASLRKFRTENDLRSGPCSERTLQRLVEKFKATGSVQDLKPKGRPPLSEIDVAEILNTSNELAAESTLNISSAREVARRLDKPVSTVRNVMRKTLGLRPYHLKVVHELHPRDYQVRVDFALKCLAQIDFDPGWISRILWSDEAHFYLHGGVNKRSLLIFVCDARRT